MLKKTDRQVYPNVYMPLSAIYNPHYTPERADAIACMIVKAMPVLKRILGLQSFNVKVRVCPIKRKSVNGSYYYATQTAWVDFRRSPRKVLETLCHEMVHAQQYISGRLVRSNNKHSLWDGQMIKANPTSYAAYRALPWEAEAFERQAGLADLVEAEIGKVE